MMSGFLFKPMGESKLVWLHPLHVCLYRSLVYSCNRSTGMPGFTVILSLQPIRRCVQRDKGYIFHSLKD